MSGGVSIVRLKANIKFEEEREMIPDNIAILRKIQNDAGEWDKKTIEGIAGWISEVNRNLTQDTDLQTLLSSGIPSHVEWAIRRLLYGERRET